MFNKRGTAYEEFGGALMLLFVSAVVLVLFGSCTVSKIKNQYEEIQFSKSEIDVIKDLNTFLEMVDDENKKMSELIQEYLIDHWDEGRADILKARMDAIAQEHFPRPRRLMLLILPDEAMIYDSFNRNVRSITYDEKPEGRAIIPVPTGPNQYDYVAVVVE